jgi:hypothetical protein
MKTPPLTGSLQPISLQNEEDAANSLLLTLQIQAKVTSSIPCSVEGCTASLPAPNRAKIIVSKLSNTIYLEVL